MGGDEDKGEVEGNLVRMCYSSRIKMKPILSTYTCSDLSHTLLSDESLPIYFFLRNERRANTDVKGELTEDVST